MLVFESSRPAMAMKKSGDDRDIPHDPDDGTKRSLPAGIAQHP
jgi:hypothetical protein